MENMIRESPLDVKRIMSAYVDAVATQIVSARIIVKPNPVQTHVIVKSSLSDVTRKKKLQLAQTFIVSNHQGKNEVYSSLCETPNTEVCDAKPVKLYSGTNIAFHSTCERQATLKSEGNPKEESQYLEIWENDKKVYDLDVSNSKEHGRIYLSEQVLPTFQWHHEKLLYIAEPPKGCPDSLFKFPVQSPDFNLVDSMGKEFVYKDNWGEDMAEVCHPQLCILDTKDYKITCKGLDRVSVLQAIWGPDCIIFVGYEEEPYRLGLKHCTNRKSALYTYDILSGNIDKITSSSEFAHVRSPRFDGDYKKLVYLRNSHLGCHHKSSQLVLLSWPAKEESVMIDIKNVENSNDFRGLFLHELPERCFSSDGRYVFFSSQCGCLTKIYTLDLKTRVIHPLYKGMGDDLPMSMQIMDVYMDQIVASVESFNTEPYLILGQWQPNEKAELEFEINWIDLVKNVRKTPSINYSIEEYMPKIIHPDYPELKCEIIIVWPIQENKEPVNLIVWCHGGPHVSFSVAYNVYAIAFAKLGFAVAMINYRGSSGNSEDGINSLPGHIGTYDISDVKEAVDLLRKNMFSSCKELKIDDKGIFILGGSHGGFIGAHLIGQYPGYFTACALRNPVINVATMLEESDIPDWSFAESSLKFQTLNAPLEDRNIQYEKSPIKYADSVVTPTIILLGKQDKRVPHFQGLTYYRILKEKNVDVRCCVYDDAHALGTVAANSDGFVQIATWFLNHKAKKA